LGDKEGAQRDEKEGWSRPPQNAEGFVLRGALHLNTNVEGALADFRDAVRLNPHSMPGLFNQAFVLAEHLGQTQQAIDLLDKLIGRYPNLAGPRATRGVFRARLGQRQPAHEDDREARKLAGDTGELLYLGACVHALTSSRHPEDRQQAFRLLSLALQRGVGHDRLDSDRNLAPLRQDRRFDKLRSAVQTIKWGVVKGR
jgi:tetratricopeptide (TPR) repeat protein